MKKRRWIAVCPVCEEQEEVDLEDEYTEEELAEKGQMINDSKIISHCSSCLINGKKGM